MSFLAPFKDVDYSNAPKLALQRLQMIRPGTLKPFGIEFDNLVLIA
jgi:hypothetical protein